MAVRTQTQIPLDCRDSVILHRSSREVEMKRFLLLVILLGSFPVLSQVTASNSNPRVRTITAFVRLDHANFQKQVADTLIVLRSAESEFKSRGYEVQSVRITTQPLSELVSGLSEEQAFAFLKQFDDLSVKEKFLANIGPAWLGDADDPS